MPSYPQHHYPDMFVNTVFHLLTREAAKSKMAQARRYAGAKAAGDPAFQSHVPGLTRDLLVLAAVEKRPTDGTHFHEWQLNAALAADAINPKGSNPLVEAFFANVQGVAPDEKGVAQPKTGNYYLAKYAANR